MPRARYCTHPKSRAVAAASSRIGVRRLKGPATRLRILDKIRRGPASCGARLATLGTLATQRPARQRTQRAARLPWWGPLQRPALARAAGFKARTTDAAAESARPSSSFAAAVNYKLYGLVRAAMASRSRPDPAAAARTRVSTSVQQINKTRACCQSSRCLAQFGKGATRGPTAPCARATGSCAQRACAGTGGLARARARSHRLCRQRGLRAARGEAISAGDADHAARPRPGPPELSLPRRQGGGLQVACGCDMQPP